ncbi:MAG: hypothetical protein Q4C33_01055 [bacterium]|nr:hypothetical protein [bacterium]
MKKFLLGLLLVVPFSVNAMAVSETFDVGNEVIVALKEGDTEQTGGRAFHVLKPSAAGEETVTLIFDGTADEKRSDGAPVSPTIYDEVTPGEHEPTTILEKAYIYNSLIEGTRTWRVESVRLLTVEDLKELGIDKQIGQNFSWLAPHISSPALLPEDYNYWTQSATEDSTTENPKVYCVTASTDTSSGIYATLEGKEIGGVSNNPKCAVRPVVVVKKEYILCNNSKPKPTTTKAPQVDTGVEDYYLPLGIVMGASVLGYLVLRKKDVFSKL